MRKTKVFTIFLGVSLLAVNVLPNIEKKLFAEEEHSETRKGSSYGDQTGMFLKMDEDGKITATCTVDGKTFTYDSNDGAKALN